jgi:predicted AlkP superfamily phosphohydrolase/phosphomutase
MSPTRPVVVIGFDAMDAGIAQHMVQEGRLPAVAALMRDGARTTVTNPPGLVVGSTWPSFWSGLWPSRHGFYCFQQLEPHSYKVRRYSPKDVVAPSFWSTMAGAGKRVCIVDVPLTPLTRPANGVHVIDWGTHDRMLEFETWPADFQREIVADIGPYPIANRCDHYAAEGRWDDLLRDLKLGIERKTELNVRLLERERWDAFVSIYAESHCAGHQFWWAHDPQHPRYSADAGDPLLQVYEALDQALGRVLAHVPAEANVFVLMSHGIGSHHDADHLLPRILNSLDEAYGPTSRARVLTEKVRRLLLRWRERLRPRSPDPLAATPRWVDASRRFFRLPNNEMFGGVRLNIAGREPRGRVRPGPELDELVIWLERELLALTDPDTGRRIVRRVLKARELYTGELRDALPDLMIDWDRSAPITAVSSEKLGVIRGEYSGVRTGDHRSTGLLLARGPDVSATGIGAAVGMVDLAPTLASLLGLPLVGLDGAPIPALSGGAFADAR